MKSAVAVQFPSGNHKQITAMSVDIMQLRPGSVLSAGGMGFAQFAPSSC